MILTCPACATRFLVPDAAFGPTPETRKARRVRCGKCKQDWMAEPPVDAPTTPADFTAALDARAAATEDSVKTESVSTAPSPVGADFPQAELRPIPPGSNLPARRRKIPHVPANVRKLGGLMALALVTTGLGFMLYGSATGRLDGIGGLFGHSSAPQLAIENVATRYIEQTGEDNAPKSWALLVEGNVRNPSHDEAIVPPLILATRDAHGELLSMTRPSVQLAKLAPGAVTGFTATLTNVSDKVAAVTVQFGAADAKTTAKPAAEKTDEKADDGPPPAPPALVSSDPAPLPETTPAATPEPHKAPTP